MPELPEVEVVRMGLAPHLCHRRVREVQIFRPDLRYPLPDLSTVLPGHGIRRLSRRGKYLLFFFDHRMLAWHLGMSGRFHLAPAAEDRLPHEHVRIVFEGGMSLRYQDPRRFGYVGLFPCREWEKQSWFASLGPEPLGKEFHTDYLAQCCRSRRAAIKQVLMDARTVAGIGNIYACESLFRARIHPKRAANRIRKARLERLVAAIREVLTEAIAAGGSTIRDFVDAAGRPGFFAHAFAVYGRTGKPCTRCGTPIRRIKIGGRGTFYCPACQK